MNNDYNKWSGLIWAKLKQDETFTALYQILIMMKESGIEQQDAYNLLANFREKNKDSISESQEDIILELLDVASGYCSSYTRLWDGYINRST